MIDSQNRHIDKLNEEKMILQTKHIKAKEEPSKINNNINKSQKAVEKLNEKIDGVEKEKQGVVTKMSNLETKSNNLGKAIDSKT